MSPWPFLGIMSLASSMRASSTGGSSPLRLRFFCQSTTRARGIDEEDVAAGDLVVAGVCGECHLVAPLVGWGVLSCVVSVGVGRQRVARRRRRVRRSLSRGRRSGVRTDGVGSHRSALLHGLVVEVQLLHSPIDPAVSERRVVVRRPSARLTGDRTAAGSGQARPLVHGLVGDLAPAHRAEPPRRVLPPLEPPLKARSPAQVRTTFQPIPAAADRPPSAGRRCPARCWAMRRPRSSQKPR